MSPNPGVWCTRPSYIYAQNQAPKRRCLLSFGLETCCERRHGAAGGSAEVAPHCGARGRQIPSFSPRPAPLFQDCVPQCDMPAFHSVPPADTSREHIMHKVDAHCRTGRAHIALDAHSVRLITTPDACTAPLRRPSTDFQQ